MNVSCRVPSKRKAFDLYWLVLVVLNQPNFLGGGRNNASDQLNQTELEAVHASAIFLEVVEFAQSKQFSISLMGCYCREHNLVSLSPAVSIPNSRLSTRGEEAVERRGGQEAADGADPARASQFVHGKRLCHLIDRPPDLTFNKLCRGQRWWGLKGVALVSLVELHPLDPVASHASLSGGDVSKIERKGGGGPCAVKWPEVQSGYLRTWYF